MACGSITYCVHCDFGPPGAFVFTEVSIRVYTQAKMFRG